MTPKEIGPRQHWSWFVPIFLNLNEVLCITQQSCYSLQSTLPRDWFLYLLFLMTVDPRLPLLTDKIDAIGGEILHVPHHIEHLSVSVQIFYLPSYTSRRSLSQPSHGHALSLCTRINPISPTYPIIPEIFSFFSQNHIFLHSAGLFTSTLISPILKASFSQFWYLMQ